MTCYHFKLKLSCSKDVPWAWSTSLVVFSKVRCQRCCLKSSTVIRMSVFLKFGKLYKLNWPMKICWYSLTNVCHLRASFKSCFYYSSSYKLKHVFICCKDWKFTITPLITADLLNFIVPFSTRSYGELTFSVEFVKRLDKILSVAEPFGHPV